jgi:hypothetical protein
LWLIAFGLLCIQCKQTNEQVSEDNYHYKVQRANDSPAINAVWDKDIWENTESVKLNNFMGDRPEHFPETLAKVRYDDQFIYVTFKVEDHFVRAVATETNGPVYQDSCVEFFFTPNQDSTDYFNLEMNCKGVFLFGYHLNNNETNGKVAEEDYKKIKIAYSLNKDVKKEIQEATTWVVEYALPIEILSNYMDVDKPGPGVHCY